jgi:quinoprotein glucose dehydrogenase
MPIPCSSAACAVFALLVCRTQEPYVPRIEAASDEAAQAIQGFAPAKGIQIELFAAEPRLANPVSFCVDAGGTVYVAETFRHHQGVTDIRDHMDWLDDDLASKTVEDRRAMIRKHEGANYDAGYGRAFEQVRRIVDSDGDFVADGDTVFATGFADHAAGIGAGLLAYEGSVYYTCIPDLWKLGDADGDGRAEEQQKLSSGYGVHVALLGHDLHGLVIGPDRRLYFSCGDRGFHVETKEGVIAHPQCGAVLRCELDGSSLEVWHTGLRNPQELAFDAYGNLWTGDNNSDGGDRARWVNVVEGGDSGWRYSYQWITEPIARGPWNDEKLWHPLHEGQAAYIVPPIANLADGPSGLAYYPGTGLSPAYDGHFFLCDFRGDASSSGIHTFTVKPKGAFWELGPVSHFVWGALVTDCAFGPDGGLWFSDWVYGWEQTGKGRIYRAVDPEAQRSALVTETRALLANGMDGRTEEELAELLAHPDRRVRQEAQFALADLGAIEELTRVAHESSNLFSRLHAIWGLGIAGRKDPTALRKLLGLTRDREPEVRAQAIRVIGDERQSAAGSLPRTSVDEAVLELLDDTSPRVRFFAAIAAGRLHVIGALQPLARILRETGDSDPNLRHAAVMGLMASADDPNLDRLAADFSPDVRMGVLLVLRRLKSQTIARFLLDDDPSLVLEAARAIHDVPIEGALESLAMARVGAEQLAAGERALVRRVLNANYRLGRSETLASYAERADLSVEARVEALDMLAHWSAPSARDRVTNEWRPFGPRKPESIRGLPALAARLASSLADAPDAVLEGLARFAGAVQAREAAGVLAELVADRKRGSGVKTAALEALEAMRADNLVPTVRAALGDLDGRVRASALERLERIAPDEVLAALPEVAASGEIAERRAAYRLLTRHAEPEASETLARELGRLEDELVPAELALDLLSACEQQGTPALKGAVEHRRTARSGDAQLAPYLDSLFGGEEKRGSDVFQRVDLSCTRCHAWWRDADERVGPNLFGVGRRLTRLQILESIVGPNRRTTPGFGARAFFLADGRVVSGRVFEESDTLVRLFDANNNPIALERAEITDERADLSAMPEDLAKSISPLEMRDLLEYLSTL